jgi:site-specific recombinase XerD
MNNLPDILKENDLKLFRMGLNNVLQKNSYVHRKDEFSMKQLTLLLTTYDHSKYIDIRNETISVVSFFCRDRISDALSIIVKDVEYKVNENKFVFKIEKSKSLPNGGLIIKELTNLVEKIPAVEIMKEYYEKYALLKKDDLLFGIVPKTFRQDLKGRLKMCNIPEENYSTHSFRRGFVIWCLLNEIPEGVIKQVGGWNGNQIFPYEISRTNTEISLIKRKIEKILARNKK